MTAPGEQVSSVVGDFYVSPNPWGLWQNVKVDWRLQAGIGASSSDARAAHVGFEWDFSGPQADKEIWAFPSAVYGVGGGYSGKWPDWDGRLKLDLPLPAEIRDIERLMVNVDRHVLTNVKGIGQVTIDIWGLRPGTTGFNVNEKDAAGNPRRLIEIMVPTQSINGYGIPNDPEAASIARPSPKAGRFSSAYRGREIINGKTYDVYRAQAGKEWGQSWDLIIFLPVDWPTIPGRTALDVVPLMKFITDRDWAPDDTIIMGVEYGVEPSGSINTWKGDAGLSSTVRGVEGCSGRLIVRDLRVDVKLK